MLYFITFSTAAAIFIGSVNVSPEIGIGGCIGEGTCRRRRLMNAEANQRYSDMVNNAANVDLCAATTTHFRDELLNDFLNVMLSKGGNANGMGSIAESMGDWCLEMENRRRAEADGVDGWQSYADSVVKRMGADDDQEVFRRAIASNKPGWMIDAGLATSEALPYNAYQQCRGYAAAMAHAVQKNSQPTDPASEGAADIYSVSANGDGDEQMEGCANVVNTVNDAIKNKKIDGLEVIEYHGAEVVIVNDPSLIKTLGKGLATLVLAGGGLAFKLMDVCHHFEEVLM